MEINYTHEVEANFKVTSQNSQNRMKGNNNNNKKVRAVTGGEG
jgi:hypothetical protein